MKRITLFRIQLIIVVIVSFIIPSPGLAITQTRVSQINQFIAELERGKFSDTESIQKRAKELKKGLSAKELSSMQLVEKMDNTIEKALATVSKKVTIAQQEQEELDKSDLVALYLAIDDLTEQYAQIKQSAAKGYVLKEAVDAVKIAQEYSAELNTLTKQKIDVNPTYMTKLNQIIKDLNQLIVKDNKAIEQDITALSLALEVLLKPTGTYDAKTLAKQRTSLETVEKLLNTHFKNHPNYKKFTHILESVKKMLETLENRLEEKAVKGSESLQELKKPLTQTTSISTDDNTPIVKPTLIDIKGEKPKEIEHETPSIGSSLVKDILAQVQEPFNLAQFKKDVKNINLLYRNEIANAKKSFNNSKHSAQLDELLNLYKIHKDTIDTFSVQYLKNASLNRAYYAMRYQPGFKTIVNPTSLTNTALIFEAFIQNNIDLPTFKTLLEARVALAAAAGGANPGPKVCTQAHEWLKTLGSYANAKDKKNAQNACEY